MGGVLFEQVVILDGLNLFHADLKAQFVPCPGNRLDNGGVNLAVSRDLDREAVVRGGDARLGKKPLRFINLRGGTQLDFDVLAFAELAGISFFKSSVGEQTVRRFCIYNGFCNRFAIQCERERLTNRRVCEEIFAADQRILVQIAHKR